MRYVMALDQGTTSSRTVIFDENGKLVSQHNIEFRQIYPQPGWVEHDPNDILESQITSIKAAVEKAQISVDDIAAIGITNQRETAILWDKATGKPVYNAIVWQCRRTASIIEDLLSEGCGEIIRRKTGLIPDAYFSGSKIKWMLDNVPGARRDAEAGKLAFGTVDSFLVYNLTGKKAHVTDVTNASRTMLFNIKEMKWDHELLRMLNIPEALLPTVVDSSFVVGYLDKSILGKEIPIASMAGDQHAALFGQACFKPGMVKNTYGTGCFMLMNTGDKPVESKNNLLTTMAWQIDGKPTYALEGSVFVAGAVIQWLRDELKLIKTAAETEEMAKSLPDNGSVYLVPAFTGLGAPYWDMYARGTIVGLTRGTQPRHIVRAALESMAYQTNDVLTSMISDLGIAPQILRVDGGASNNGFLMQFQADISRVTVDRPMVTETTALGAAMLAGRAVGLWSDNDLNNVWQPEHRFTPNEDEAKTQKLVRKWKKAVERACLWIDEDD